MAAKSPLLHNREANLVQATNSKINFCIYALLYVYMHQLQVYLVLRLLNDHHNDEDNDYAFEVMTMPIAVATTTFKQLQLQLSIPCSLPRARTLKELHSANYILS